MQGVVFVGPNARIIRAMGDKAMARKIAKEAGVATTPGSAGNVSGVDEALSVAGQIGYPVILKASAGGGGRGMRIVWQAADLRDAFQQAARIGMTEGMAQCSPVLLEPITLVEVNTPSDSTSRINQIITGKRGQLLGYDGRPGWPGSSK